ncbi:PaaI family thioesterase [Pseudonocardiaceae bacterium YIM PH 21723]|nr:PaaI family thioesterase [Pseudonocardiaceae bacterium YIM PH 21723]
MSHAEANTAAEAAMTDLARVARHLTGENPTCLICSPTRPESLKLRATGFADGVLTAEFTANKDQEGGPGYVHGGVLAGAIDEVFGGAAFTAGSIAVTGNLNIDYRRPVELHTRAIITAKVDSVDGRKVSVSGQLRLGGENGPLAITARGLFVQVKPSHFKFGP